MKTATQSLVSFKMLAACLVFSSSSLALDLGGIKNQVQQAVQAQVPAQPANNQVVPQSPSAQRTNDGNAVLPNASADSDPCRIAEAKGQNRQPGQSMEDFIEQGNKKKAARAECEGRKAAEATIPNYVETTEALELKGIRIGMTEQELLKLLPQGIVIRPRAQTADWVKRRWRVPPVTLPPPRCHPRHS